MNYSLAKELRDAGFRQGHPIDHHLGGTWISQNPEEITYHQLGWEDECYIPTLSELIEACGEKFSYLQYEPEDKETERWSAGAFLVPDDGNDVMASEFGSTPEEAVARLLLVLNPKVTK